MSQIPATEGLPAPLVERISEDRQQLVHAGRTVEVVRQNDGLLLTCHLPDIDGATYLLRWFCSSHYPAKPPQLTIIEQIAEQMPGSTGEPSQRIVRITTTLADWQGGVTTLPDLVDEVAERLQSRQFVRKSVAVPAAAPPAPAAPAPAAALAEAAPATPAPAAPAPAAAPAAPAPAAPALAEAAPAAPAPAAPALATPRITEETTLRGAQPGRSVPIVVAIVLVALLVGGGVAWYAGLLPVSTAASDQAAQPGANDAGADNAGPQAFSTELPVDALATAITTITPTASLPATPTPNATATAQAVQASQDATATVQAAAQAAATSTAVAEQATTTAQIAGIAAEEAQRAASHASDTLGVASARYAPDLEPLLLANGYRANIIQVGAARSLRASQLNYSNSTWTRDLDYAISGYSYALGNMSVLRENAEVFLARVDGAGIAPETIYLREGRIDFENRTSWDSMPNLIHAVYVYVAKTGDRAFYRQHRETMLRMGQWIAALDINGDGLPNTNNYPFGYFDSVRNSEMHTYAIAKFYAAYNELADLEAAAGFDGETLWRERAAWMRANYHRPHTPDTVGEGYWVEGQPWPIAWHRPDAGPVLLLETFGVFSAVQTGLIGPQDEGRYQALMEHMHGVLPELIAGPSPLRLSIGGYEPEMRREVIPPVPVWMLDASAPWVVGVAAPSFAQAGYAPDAEAVMQAYMTMARATDPPILEFAAGEGTRYGPGDSGDRGRTWDTAAWFLAVYGGHYGIKMTPAALVVEPYPFRTIAHDGFENLSYQGAQVQMELDAASRTYTLQVSRPTVARLRPMNGAQSLRLNGQEAGAEKVLVLQPDQPYTVVSSAE